MNLKVRHNELNNVKDTIKEDAIKIDEEINYWTNSIEKLKSIWQGEDADVFYTKANTYVQRMKVIPECFRTMSEFMSDANVLYEDVDNSLKDELEKESMNENLEKEYLDEVM